MKGTGGFWAVVVFLLLFVMFGRWALLWLLTIVIVITPIVWAQYHNDKQAPPPPMPKENDNDIECVSNDDENN